VKLQRICGGCREITDKNEISGGKFSLGVYSGLAGEKFSHSATKAVDNSKSLSS
jgi:hypothetical protein